MGHYLLPLKCLSKSYIKSVGQLDQALRHGIWAPQVCFLNESSCVSKSTLIKCNDLVEGFLEVTMISSEEETGRRKSQPVYP